MKPQAHSHTYLCSATHPDTHTRTHTPRGHTCTRTHAAAHALPRTPHRHTYSQACTHVHILTLIYKCTLTRGQSKKNYYSSERNRLPSPPSARTAWAAVGWAQSVLGGPGPLCGAGSVLRLQVEALAAPGTAPCGRAPCPGQAGRHGRGAAGALTAPAALPAPPMPVSAPSRHRQESWPGTQSTNAQAAMEESAPHWPSGEGPEKSRTVAPTPPNITFVTPRISS